jgi:hypothetical protein
MRAISLLSVLLVSLGCVTSSQEAGLGVDEQPRPVRILSPDGISYETAVGDSRNVRTFDLPAHPTSVWEHLPGVFESLELEITLGDRLSRTLGLENVRLRRIGGTRPSRYLNCGHGVGAPNADSYDVYLTLVAQVLPAAGGGSQVQLHLAAFARDPTVLGTPVTCSSTGRLEDRFSSTLTLLVASN